jgi:hypothetical protein
MPEESLIRTLLLPELSLVSIRRCDGGGMEVIAEKRSKEELNTAPVRDPVGSRL